MALVRWNPWREVSTLQNRFNHVFDDAFFRPFRTETQAVTNHWQPAVDIFDKEDRMVIKAELPGVAKEDIKVDLKERVLTLKGSRSFENEVKDEKVYRRERAYGTFQRAFSLPEDLDAETISADYKDGVLTIEIPKAAKEQPKQITIN